MTPACLACCWDCDAEVMTTYDPETLDKTLPPGWTFIEVGEPYGRVMSCEVCSVEGGLIAHVEPGRPGEP
jgi:hypothetical protein